MPNDASCVSETIEVLTTTKHETTDNIHAVDIDCEKTTASPSTVPLEGRESPRNWSTPYKWAVVLIISGFAFTANLTILACEPGMNQTLIELHSTNQLDATIVVSIWNIGAMLGCLIVGPLSEIYGRLPVYNLANLLCLTTIAAETQSKNVATLIALRFFTGLTITGTSLNPSIIGDLFVVEERGKTQSLQSLMPLLGPAVGPIAGGWIAQHKGWRWTYWLCFFVLAFFQLMFMCVYRETYEPVILHRKIAATTKSSNDQVSHLDAKGKRSLTIRALGKAFFRPIQVFSKPVFLVLAIPSAIMAGYVFLIVTTLAQLMQSIYSFSEGAAGLSFLGITLGMIFGALTCSIILDRYIKKMKQYLGTEIKPEWRLPLMSAGFFITPVSLFLYGWTLDAKVHWVVPISATSLCGFASFLISLPVTVYFTDVFGRYRASALSALSTFRYIVTGVLPLAGPPLYEKLGLGWGNSLLAFVAIIMIPVPFVMLRYGESIRTKSKFEECT